MSDALILLALLALLVFTAVLVAWLAIRLHAVVRPGPHGVFADVVDEPVAGPERRSSLRPVREES